MNKSAPPSLKAGYFLGQDASSIGRNALLRRLDPYFAPFLSVEGACRFFDEIAGKVDGMDFVNYWYEPGDAEPARAIAEAGRARGIDLWAGLRWFKQFRDLPPVPAEYAAWTMDEGGHIIPALWEERNHVVDYLNPQAMDWFIEVLEQRYWRQIKGAVNGLFFPESRVACEVPFGRHGLKLWTLHAYSPAALEAWRNYCAAHDVRWQGHLLDRFPVPLPRMANAGGLVRSGAATVMSQPNQTVYVPDNRPETAPAFTRFADIPRGTEVWLAWEDFLCTQFHQCFLRKIAAWANRYHADQPDWRGVCFFNNDVSLLDYRDFTGDAQTGFALGYWPQGRRMGVDLRRLLADPEITCFISETIQPVPDYIFQTENYLSRGMALAKAAGRAADYGFMLHYSGDVHTPLARVMDETQEELRWRMFHKYRPPVFSFYSIPAVLVSTGALYRKEASDRFWERVAEYKRSFKQ